MIKRTSQYLVPFVLGAMAMLSFAFSGCERKEKSVPATQGAQMDPPEVYMKDAEFRGKLDAEKQKRMELFKTRAKLVDEMQAKIDAVRAKMPTAEPPAVKAELEKDPEWNSLYKRVEDLNAALNDNRLKATAIVHERMTRKISK